MSMKRKAIQGLSNAAFLAALAGSPALAQTSSGPQAEAELPASEDNGLIVVTAQKRSERLLDVPISIAVAQGETLRNLNFNAATDLQYIVPGLGLGDANTPRGAGFRIRGVGTNVFADGIEQSVGTVLDGVPLARAGQGLSDLIDIERIEVLRGPQGMLFGRNASAGVINIITRKPTDELSAEALASYGTDNDIRASATVAGPLGANIGARLTGFYNAQDGYITNLANGQDLNNRKEYGVRGVVEFNPGDNTEIVLRADWSKRDNRAAIWTIRSLASNTLRPLLTPQVIAAAGPRSEVVNLNAPVFNEVEGWGVSGEINQALGDYTLTSITAYRKWDQIDNNDADQSLFNVLDLNTGSNDLYQLSQELRITSPADQFVSFVAGLFYYRSSNENLSQQRGRFAASLALAGAAGVSVGGQPPSALGGREVSIDVDVRDLAAFGQASINFSSAFRAIVGARYTNTKVGATWNRRVAPGASAGYNGLLGAAFAPLSYDLETEDNDISWRAGLQFDPSPDQNLYATVSRGYKAPGFDTQVDFTVQPGRTALQSALVQPETATNYEVGYKASFLDQRLDVSVAAYLTDFENFQAQVFETPPGALLGTFRIRNAGLLRSKGFELEFNARPGGGFTAGISLAYNDTRFRRFIAAACPRLGQLITDANNNLNCGRGAAAFDASGQRAPNAPRWTVSANLGYEQDISDDVAGYLQGNLFLRSDNFFAAYPDNIPNQTRQDGYAIVNGSAGLSFADGKITAAVFVRNLFDSYFVTSIFDLPLAGPGDFAQFTTRDAQRTVGVQVGLRF